MNKNILIIEDDLTSIYMVPYLLRAHDYEIIVAYDGLEGLNKAKEYIPDIILLDIQMPEMNGFEVTRYLKKDSIMKDIPVIMLTAYASIFDKNEALNAGADGYIEKPIDPDVFISQMESMVTSFHTGSSNRI